MVAFKKTVLSVLFLVPNLALAQDEFEQFDDRFAAPREVLSEPGNILPRIDPLAPPPAAEGIRFTLSGVIVEGNSVLSETDLTAVYGELVGSQISVAQVFAIANDITAAYGEAGFPLSRAIIPAQEIDDPGVLRVVVVEGFADSVEVSGPAAENPLVAGHVERITGERPLSSATLERYLLLGDDLPGFELRSTLRRSETTASATDILLSSRATDPTELSLSFDNLGTEAVGPHQLSFEATISNLLHSNSATSLRLINASLNDELIYASFEHSLVLNSEGTELSAGFRGSSSVPGTDTLTAIEFESEAHTWFIGIDHPFIRSRSQNLRGFATFEARNSESRSIGAPISQDRIRSVRLGADYDRALENGSILAASVELSFGIPGFGASANDDSLNSRDEGVVDYQKFSADVSYIIPLGLVASDLNGWTFTSEGTLQLTADPLLASEECAFGGGTYGRAFDFSALSGDQCAALSLEVGRELQPDRTFQNLRYYAFTERAAVRNLDSTAAGSWATITSAGIGSEIDFNESVYGIFEVAFPMENSAVAALDRTPRATFSLNMEF